MNNDPLELLAGLEIACRFLYTCLHQAPSQDFVNQLTQEALLDHWPIDAVDADMEKGLTSMKAYLGEAQDDGLSFLKEDFNALFVGPHALKAVPWASVYLTEEQLTLTEPTMAIRDFYRRYGVEIHTGENEPDDHLGLQLAFLAHLLAQLLAAIEKEQCYEPWMAAIQAFLTDHMLTWSGRFLEIMEEAAVTGFYKGVAQLTRASLKQLANVSGAEYRIVRLYR